MLGLIANSENLSVEQLSADVAQSLRSEDESGTPDSDWENLESRLSRLLGTTGLWTSSRAGDIQHEFERIFSTARVLTDIRPLFAKDSTAAVAGALIVHQLKITVFRDGNYEDMYVSMDDADIIVLRQVLERAEAKGKTLASLMANASIRCFD